MGMGHVSRGLVIARAMERESVEVLFCTNLERAVTDKLKESCVEHVAAPIDAEGFEVVLRQEAVAVVLDTKKAVRPFVKRLKERGKAVIVIDSSGETLAEADLSIFPTALFRESPSANGAAGRVAGGAEYIPIDESYKEVKPSVERDLPHPYRVLVTMGGSDPNRLTSKVLSALKGVGEKVEITAVVGPAFSPDPRLAEIENGAAPNVRVVSGISDLSRLMARSHVVITALGITIYEAAYLGIPLIVLGNYRSDARDMEAINRSGFGLALGYHEDVTETAIAQGLQRLVTDRKLYETMSRKGRALVDGLGAQRIVQLIKGVMPSGDAQSL